MIVDLLSFGLGFVSGVFTREIVDAIIVEHESSKLAKEIVENDGCVNFDINKLNESSLKVLQKGIKKAQNS